ncbi:tyrosyl-DNA phosphodiesterase 2 isoform X1 [Xiphias gladius]|uniref:tyrosyl-DNA phosphodiesterase 2 isoform X1 n=2 Tax=Xiphias gladius TaxID=8245 RepID=UPI001A97F675|nr:tyrosyl-DNA phosphodiesterase 2 isoform X1 [Xiphias gladius]XP_039977102.1 tyrosyl-DNA phosphodiesterase 2 isoform X1 [Xiphias gladius]XP_039977103.1 tyrosyl-DNA phosphodiesterase 2 isoform X1 [Xiphias gladius]XP_039977104.1 tyrosyl-DNA phosphodiesterase 2 isoform X1 [Xiphias gladius]XP_039977106.1 tyrosyl-DNA phosphodiesterase 2 isoform X1 [Xiphias gladius]
MASTSESDKPAVSNVEEERTRLRGEFAAIAGTDSAVAQRYLAENEWEMERALDAFFEADMEEVFGVEDYPETDTSPKAKRQEIDEKPAVDCIDLTTDSPASTHTPPEEDDSKLSVISWNVDGLDTDNLAERARGLCSYLVLYTPDVVFLQELIPPYVQYLKKRAVSYLIIEGGENHYFTGMMLKRSRVKLVESEIVTYPSTQMKRNLLLAQVDFKGQKLCLMTSHLESCKGHAEERMKQLRVVMRRMSEAPDNVTVLFGGDTNLRDTEVAKVGLPSSVCDVWEQLGKQEHCRYTWDTKTNNNKNIPFVSRCRFDRVYLRPATKDGVPRLAPDHMALVGLEKLDCGRYTSDHWGIYCSFSSG